MTTQEQPFSQPAKVILSACPNPDYAGINDKGHLRIKAHFVPVSSWHEASEVCQRFIHDEELGSGNFDGGEVFDETGNLIGYISYNGRCWLGTHENRETNIEVK